ncbi:MAG TPA: recombinase family protein [Candidatus Woesebacteria bacterium]|nr:recombinase family protein [Candidatus Woesebacteria bacterium]
MYVTGKYSFQTISEKLYNELNFKTRQGKKFSKGRIQDILSNVAYMGQIEYKKIGKKNQGLHKPIVTPNIFLLAQDVMESRGNIRKAEKGKLDFLYKGFVACPECGKALYAAYSTGGSGKKHLYYCCRNRKHGAVNIKAKDIQKAFEKALESLQISDEVMEIVRKFVGRRLEEVKELMNVKRKLSQLKRKNSTHIKTTKKAYLMKMHLGLFYLTWKIKRHLLKWN